MYKCIIIQAERVYFETNETALEARLMDEHSGRNVKPFVTFARL